MSTQPIRIGIAGLGRSGWDIHARLLEPLAAYYQVAAVVDADPARRAEAVQRFGCAAYSEFEELLADPNVELVVVALPSHRHTEATLAALAVGKHVICEKPMAITLPDADRMVEAARAAGRVLTVFQQRRYNPDFVKVREVIASGLLGRVIQIRLSESRFSRRWDWQTLQKYGGGSLNNTGPHFLDQALQLFGPTQPAVLCHLDRGLTLGDADDHVKVVLRAAGAPTIDIEISSCDAYPDETWHVLGTQGGLKGTSRSIHWKWIVPSELPARALDLQPTPDRSYNRDEMIWHEDSWQLGNASVNEAHAHFYTDLYATIREGAPLAITPESVRRVVWLQEECHRQSPLAQDYF